MEESDFSDGNEEEAEQEEALDPDNPEHAFAILERGFNKVATLLPSITLNPILADRRRNRAKP